MEWEEVGGGKKRTRGRGKDTEGIAEGLKNKEQRERFCWAPDWKKKKKKKYNN